MTKLSLILEHMHSEAAGYPGAPARRKLHSGLHVELTAEEDEFILTIARESVFPSPVEFRAILNAWPYPIRINDEPESLIINGRKCLRGRVPGQKQVTLWPKLI